MKDLIYGPINKSLHTQKFELLVKCILQRPDAIHYDLHKSSNGKDALFAQIGQAKVNISSLVQKMNFNHLSFSKTDSEQYFKRTTPKFYVDNQQDKYSELTKAEKYVIQGYTGTNYEKINSFLHGKLFDNFCSTPKKLDFLSHNLITNIGFLASGLNKIPPTMDYKIPTFRGEYHVSIGEIAHRIQCIEDKHNLDMKPAFMSTSIDKTISHEFSDGCIIKFEMPYGKDIADLSLYHSESEYLLNPNHIIWDSYTVKNGTFYFKARVVAPLVEQENEIQPEELKEFNELLNFAKTSNIDLDFTTPFNKENYIKPLKDSVPSLKEIIDNNVDTSIDALLSQFKQPTLETVNLPPSLSHDTTSLTESVCLPNPQSIYETFENTVFLYM